MQDPEYREKRRLASKQRRIDNPVMFDCVICGTTFHRKRGHKTCSDECGKILKRETERKWKQRPEVKARVSELRKQRRQRPEIKEQESAYRKIRNRRPHVMERNRQLQRDRLSQPTHRISNRMRANMHCHLKNRGISKTHKNFDILGYTPKELVAHLESQFTDGMSWENMDEWHIDHIRPVVSFNFDSMDHPEFKECWALENLQPMWATDNIRKSSLWEGKRYRYKVVS
jgi:uncharacterized Zn finger protein (UPF0148 family)